MAKAKTTIKIDGEKLRSLLEDKTGKTIYQIAQDNGYSKNIISNAIREGYATSVVQNIARLYDIAPVEYQILELKHTEADPELKGQISIDDIEALKREELEALLENAFTVVLKKVSKGALKTVIKESIVEILGEYAFAIVDDPIRCQRKIYLSKRED